MMKKILSLTLILTIAINSFSQKTKNICHGDLCVIKCNCPLGYDIKEISKLTHIKNQFYKNESDHLYIKTGSVRPGKNGEIIEKQFFSSLISQDIDVRTFEEFADGSWYAKDKNYIYYTKPNSDGDHIWLVKNADVRTFKCLNTFYGNYAIDKNKIYKDDEVLIGFKPNQTKFKRNKRGLIIELVQGKLKHKIE